MSLYSNFGIGIYRGLKNLNKTECFVIEYEGEEVVIDKDNGKQIAKRVIVRRFLGMGVRRGKK